MGLLDWACKNIGLPMTGVSPEITKIYSGLRILLEDSAKLSEWQDILKEVDNEALEILSTPRFRKELLNDYDGCTPLAVNKLCYAVLSLPSIEARAKQASLNILDLQLAMVMLPRSLVNKTFDLLKEIGLTGMQFREIHDEIAHLVLSPRGVASIINKSTCDNSKDSILTAAFFLLENQKLEPFLVELRINVKEFYTNLNMLKQKYGVA